MILSRSFYYVRYPLSIPTPVRRSGCELLAPPDQRAELARPGELVVLAGEFARALAVGCVTERLGHQSRVGRIPAVHPHQPPGAQCRDVAADHELLDVDRH